MERRALLPSFLRDRFEQAILMTHEFSATLNLTEGDLMALMVAAGVTVITDPVTRINNEVWDVIRCGMREHRNIDIDYQAPVYTGGKTSFENTPLPELSVCVTPRNSKHFHRNMCSSAEAAICRRLPTGRIRCSSSPTESFLSEIQHFECVVVD